MSFTAQHNLEDAEQENIEVTYRFRRAEKKESSNYASNKKELLRLEAKISTVREHIYRDTTYVLCEAKQTMKEFIGCPEPPWI